MKNIFKILLLVIVVCLGAVVFSACTGCKENRAYSLIYTAGEGGSIEGDVCQTVHNGESGTEVVAVAGDGFEFVQWSDGVTTQSRTDKNVSHDINVTARFAKVEYFTITYDAGEGGSIEGLTKQTVKSGESGQEVTAVPNEGYRFVKWSDGKTLPKRQDKITEDCILTAEFEFFYEGGDGTASNPFTITNYTHLKNMWYYPESNFKLLNDLDLSGVVHEPIFDDINYFKGRFDGGGCTINNLIVETDSNYPSLFGVISGGIIRNLSLLNANIKMSDFDTIKNKQQYCGGIVAGKSTGYIRDVNVSGIIDVEGLSHDGVAVGGLVGLVSGTIENCCSNVQLNVKNVISENSTNMQLPFVFGCMFGVCDSTFIVDCEVEGKINIKECCWIEDEMNNYTEIHVGGIAGYYFTARQVKTYVRDCKTDVVIFGDNYYQAGGFIGRLEIADDTELIISDCSVYGDIEIGTVGGFICSGFAYGNLLIESCYVENEIVAFSRVAGFIERYTGTANKCILSNCYFIGKLNTHRYDDADIVVGEITGFANQITDVNFIDCFSSIDGLAKYSYGFAWSLTNCKMESCYVIGQIDAIVFKHVALFVYDLYKSQVSNCYLQINVGLYLVKESIPIVKYMCDSTIKNFYYAGNAVGNAIYIIEDSVIENFHMLRISDFDIDFVGIDDGIIPSKVEITVYVKKEEMYFLADKLNKNLSEEVWENVLGDYPKLKTETNSYNAIVNKNQGEIL